MTTKTFHTGVKLTAPQRALMRAIYEGGNDCGEIDMADTRINDRTMRALRQRKLVWTDLRRERYELTQLGWIVGGEVMYGRGWEPPI